MVTVGEAWPLWSQESVTSFWFPMCVQGSRHLEHLLHSQERVGFKVEQLGLNHQWCLYRCVTELSCITVFSHLPQDPYIDCYLSQLLCFDLCILLGSQWMYHFVVNAFMALLSPLSTVHLFTVERRARSLVCIPYARNVASQRSETFQLKMCSFQPFCWNSWIIGTAFHLVFLSSVTSLEQED